MPTIDELIHLYKEPSKKFQKKTYRPWDIHSHYPEKEEEEKPQKNISPPPTTNPEEDIKKPRKVRTRNGIFKRQRPEPKRERVAGNKSYYFLCGPQKEILKYLLTRSRYVRKNISYTEKITQKEIGIFTNCDIKTVSVALNRLKSKGIVSTFYKKTGKGGFSKYQVHNFDYLAANLMKK